MKRIVVAVLVTAVLLTASFAQKQAPSSSNTSLAKSRDLGKLTLRMFSNSPRVTFALATSWIPGENHKGMFRYRISVIPEQTVPPDGTTNLEETATLLKQVQSCQTFLTLLDADDFVLRKIEVPLDQGIDDQARLRALTANESAQMDANEYRNFIERGSWSISWARCAPEGLVSP